MKALLLHANRFETQVIEESTLPTGIEPELKRSSVEKMEQCVVCFFTIEKQDGEIQLENFFQDIIKTAAEFQTKNILISSFVHLSNNIADPKQAKKLYLQLMAKFETTDFVVKSSHFGYHKTLLLDIKGHPGSFRFREF